MNYFSNDLEIIITIIVINIIMLFIYHLIINKGKLYFNIVKPKLNIQNKNTWSDENNKISDNTKGIDLDFKLQLDNHKNYYTSIYNILVVKKNRFKFKEIDNQYLNLIDTVKMVTGAIHYEKLRYATLLPFEIREFQVKIKLTKEEIDNIKKHPIYILYKDGKRNKKIKLNKYLKNKIRQNKSIE